MLRKIGAAALYLTLGVMLSKVAILAINVLLARFSSTELYGQFALLRSTVNVIETTLSSSINPIITHASAKEYGNSYVYARTNTFLLILGITIVIAVTIPFWLFDERIALSLLNEPDALYVQLGIVLLLTSVGSGFVTSFLVTGHSTIFMPIASISAALVAVLLAYLFIPGNPIFWALLAIIVLHGFELAIKLVIAIRKKIVSIHGLVKFKSNLLTEFSTSLIILIISAAINAITFWLLRVMLVRTSDNFTPLALFDVSFQYIAVEMMVLNNVVTIFQSYAAKQIDRDAKELRRVYISVIMIVSMVTFAAMTVNLVFADFLIALYGKDYDAHLLRLLTAVLPFYAIAIFMNRSFVSSGRTSVLLLVSVLSSFACLIYAQLFMTNAYQMVLAFVIYYFVSAILYMAVQTYTRMSTKNTNNVCM